MFTGQARDEILVQFMIERTRLSRILQAYNTYNTYNTFANMALGTSFNTTSQDRHSPVFVDF